MIILLETIPKKLRIFKRKPMIFYDELRFKLSDIFACKPKQLLREAPQYIVIGKITVEVKKQKERVVDWDTVEYLAGFNVNGFLFPKRLSFECFDNVPHNFSEFNELSLNIKLMEIASGEFVKTMSKDKAKLRISIIDIDGKIPKLPLTYMPYVGELNVFTGESERYLKTKQTAFREFGAVFITSDNFAKIGEADLLIAPFGIPMVTENTNVSNKIVFSGVGISEPCFQGIFVDEYHIKVPMKINELIPNNYQKQTFYKALIHEGLIQNCSTKLLKAYNFSLWGTEISKNTDVFSRSRKNITFNNLRRTAGELDIGGLL